MNKKKEAKLNMYRAVISLCEENLPIVALVVAFQTSYGMFKVTVGAIAVAMGQLEAQTGEFATSKRKAKKDLGLLGSGIAGMVYAYASTIHDDVMKGAMAITYSDIYNAKDGEAGPKCQNIYDTANANLGALGDFGVTSTLLSTFQAAINDFNLKAPKPIQSRSEKKAVREQMDGLFVTADMILKEQMDKLSINFLSNGNVLFYGYYHAAREINGPGSFGTVLKIFVLNGATNEPLRGVKSYRDTSVIAKKSSNKGFVTYKNIEEGNHVFKLKHKLFADGTGTVSMSHGDKKVITVVMQPV